MYWETDLVNKSKAKGTATETAVVRYLQMHGWPNAERRALRGIADAGDITGTRGICWSVKGGRLAEEATDTEVARWLSELNTQCGHAKTDVGVLVLKRRNFSAARAGGWWAIVPARVMIMPGSVAEAPVLPVRIRLADAVLLLQWAGLGEVTNAQMVV
jgi:hypothetical protein